MGKVVASSAYTLKMDIIEKETYCVQQLKLLKWTIFAFHWFWISQWGRRRRNWSYFNHLTEFYFVGKPHQTQIIIPNTTSVYVKYVCRVFEMFSLLHEITVLLRLLQVTTAVRKTWSSDPAKCDRIAYLCMSRYSGIYRGQGLTPSLMNVWLQCRASRWCLMDTVWWRLWANVPGRWEPFMFRHDIWSINLNKRVL